MDAMMRLPPRTVLVALLLLAAAGTLLAVSGGWPPGRQVHAGRQSAEDEDADAVARQLFAGATPQPELAALRHLIMVATHAIYRGGGGSGDKGGGGEDGDEVADESRWVLEPYQVGKVEAFLAHVRTGVRMAADDATALLVFSGGKTRPAAGPRSEAQSYWEIADRLGWPDGVRARTTTEEFARDSFENLLFSVCRFHEVTGHYPERITVVSLPHKRDRFVDAHRAALRYPSSRFDYVGVGPVARPEEVQFERSLIADHFQHDPYGCRGDIQKKRAARNPGRRLAPYALSCPDLKGLLLFCGEHVYGGELPW